MPYSFITRRVEKTGYRRFQVLPAGFSEPFALYYSREWRLWGMYFNRRRDRWNLYWDKECIGAFESEEEALLYILRFAYNAEYSTFLLPSEILASANLIYPQLGWVDTWKDPGPAQVALQRGPIFRPPRRKIRLVSSPRLLKDDWHPRPLRMPSESPNLSSRPAPQAAKVAQEAGLAPEGPRALRRPISRNWSDPQSRQFTLIRRFRRQKAEELPDDECVFRLKSDFGPSEGDKS